MGDEIVVSPSSKSENDGIAGRLALRILQTSGGRQVLRPLGILVKPLLRGFCEDDPFRETRILPIGGINPFCVQAFYLDYNGSDWVPVRKRFIIAPCVGERKIRELHIFEIEYASSVSALSEKNLTIRGKKFVRFVMSKDTAYVDYTGVGLSTEEELNDKVTVDMKEYFLDQDYIRVIPTFSKPEPLDDSEVSACVLGTTCPVPDECPHTRVPIVRDDILDKSGYQEYKESRPEFNRPLPEFGEDGSNLLPDYSICHYRLFAYKLRSREWGTSH